MLAEVLGVNRSFLGSKWGRSLHAEGWLERGRIRPVKGPHFRGQGSREGRESRREEAERRTGGSFLLKSVHSQQHLTDAWATVRHAARAPPAQAHIARGR